MISKEEIRQLFHLAELENEQELRRRNRLRQDELSIEKKAKRLEFIVEHLNTSSLIAVYQTNLFPENGKIRPIGHHILSLAGMNILGTVNANKVIEDLQLKHPRITIHFTLNYPIRGVVAGGEWIEWHGKYAILIPVDDFINRIVCLHPIDTWIIGALDLPSSAEILINEDEYFRQAEVYHVNAGRAKIVPYPNDLTVHKAIEVRLKKKGYNLTEGGDHDWFETSDLKIIANFINDSHYLSSNEKDKLVRLCISKGFTYWVKIFELLAEKYRKISIPHDKTIWRDIEKFAEEVYGIIFAPASEEATTQCKDIVYWKLRPLHDASKRRQEETSRLVQSQTYTNAQEIEYLNELINTLTKIERWLNDIIQKIESQRRENQTWGEFLREERII